MATLSSKRNFLAAFDIVLLAGGTAAAAIAACLELSVPEPYLRAVDVLSVIAMCFLLSICVVETVSMIKISDSTAYTVFIAVMLLGYFVFSSDFVHLLGSWGARPARRLFAWIDFSFFLLLTLSVIAFWNYTFGVGLTKRMWICLSAGALACVSLYIGLSFAGAESAAFFLWLLLLSGPFVLSRRALGRFQGSKFSFYVTETFLCAVLGSGLAQALCGAVIPFPASGIPAIYILLDILCFSLIYIAYALRTDKEALKANEYKLRYEQVKAEALRGQIKPHFIFNSLAAIQSLYHKSLADGDHATSLFSKHLRANVEASNVDLIPFEQELDNIQVYAELENMRREKPFRVIFDIEETDFLLPVLSLQPYIENAMRYSGVNEKENGYIKISSKQTEEGIVLEIEDNGAGFDVSAIPPSSCGIRNSRERFLMLMGAEPKIESALGMGTRITVLIDKEKYEDHRS